MSTSALAAAAGARRAATPLLVRLRKDESGATAVEFGLIAVPFVMMLLGIISVCLYFFTVLELDNAVWNSARDVRTGIYTVGGNGRAADYIFAADDTEEQKDIKRRDALMKGICRQLRDEASCRSKIKIVMKKYSKGEAMSSKPDCRKNDGSLISSSTYEATDPDAFIVMTACYGWEFGGKLPFFKIGNLPDGSFLVQSTTGFVTEKYQ